MAKIFNASDINAPGICHALSASYIRASMRTGGINAEAELGSKLGAFMNFQFVNNVDDWGALLRTYHLNVTDWLSIADGDPNKVAQRVVKGNGYRLIGVGSFRLNAALGANVREGHSMACRKERGVCEFYDPNQGLWRWNSSLDLHDFIPTFLRNNYLDLLGTSCDVWVVEA